MWITSYRTTSGSSSVWPLALMSKGAEADWSMVRNPTATTSWGVTMTTDTEIGGWVMGRISLLVTPAHLLRNDALLA
jgi:hypothetical protein